MVFGQGTVWDTRRLSQTMPGHGFGQGTVWDTRKLSQTMPGHSLGQGIRVSQIVLSSRARFGTRAECPKPCPSTIWDTRAECPKPCPGMVGQGTVWDTQRECPKLCPGMKNKDGGLKQLNHSARRLLPQNTKLHPQSTEWDKALVCPELCPVRHGSGQSPRVPEREARFGTRAVCPKPCPGMVWDKARFGTQQEVK
ncbi:hypothetical protein Bbelb_110430 [Branchiostoma belcheri]|nr:hypothetical protein Bbelb_110430 [Branchiostoma belcheri]